MSTVISNITTPDAINHTVAPRCYYAVCSTAVATSTKSVTISDFSEDRVGSLIAVTFTYGANYTSGASSLSISNGSQTFNYSIYMENNYDYLIVKPRSTVLFRVASSYVSPVLFNQQKTFTNDADEIYHGGQGFDEKYYVISKQITVASLAADTNKEFNFNLVDTTGKYGAYLGMCGWSSSSRYLLPYNNYLYSSGGSSYGAGQYLRDSDGKPVYEMNVWIRNCNPSGKSGDTANMTLYFLFDASNRSNNLWYLGG